MLIKRGLQLPNELKTDRKLVYNQIANNLKLSDIPINSTIYKTTEPVLNELDNFGELTNNLLKELHVNTASFASLQKTGAELNIFRKSFKVLDILAVQQAVEVSVEVSDVLGVVSDTVVIQSNYKVNVNNYIITFLDDVAISNETTRQYINLRIELSTGTSFFLEANSKLLVDTEINRSVIPRITLTFLKAIGLSNTLESVEDFRQKIINAKSNPLKNFNSIVQEIVQEVPGVLEAETQSLDTGTSVHSIFLKSKKMELDGFDPFVQNFLVPAFINSLSTRIDYSYIITIEEAKAIDLILNITAPNVTITVESLRSKLNAELTQYDQISYDIILNILNSYLPFNQKLGINNINVELKSKNLFENNLEINSQDIIRRPLGRFFYVVNIGKT